MNAKARKAEINLRSLGLGVILFGAWTFIKFAVTLLMKGIQFDKIYSNDVIIASKIIVWIFLVLAFLIRLYIGLSARSESEGKRKRSFYLVLTGMIALVNAALIVAEIAMMVIESHGLLYMAITILIDVTSFVILIELLVNAVIIRKLRKETAA